MCSIAVLTVQRVMQFKSRPSSIGRPDALHAVQFKSLQWSFEPRSLGYEIEVLAVATKPTVCLLNEFAVQATHADDPVLYLDV